MSNGNLFSSSLRMMRELEESYLIFVTDPTDIPV